MVFEVIHSRISTCQSNAVNKSSKCEAEEAGYVGKYVGEHSSNESYATKDNYLRPSSAMSVRSKSFSATSRSSVIVLEKKSSSRSFGTRKSVQTKGGRIGKGTSTE